MDEARAARQTAVLEAILEDYKVRPWPQTTKLVADWREAANELSVHGVPLPKLHRDELLASLALAIHQLRKAGIVSAPPETKAPKPETTGRRSTAREGQQ